MKKEKQVKIKIFAVVVRGEGEDADKDNIRITSEGTMSFDGKRVEICYVEMMGEEGAAHNTLSFDVTEPNIVTLVREGAVSCVMTFSENGRYGGLYNMGFASFDFTVEQWMEAIEASVPAKFLEMNKAAFLLGRNAV